MSKMTNSMIVEKDDVHESVLNKLMNELGELPKYFNTDVIVKVVVTPLPQGDEDER